MSEPPERFPFEGERGEYLATLGLALACAGQEQRALSLVDEAERISRTVEVQTLVPLTRSIIATRSHSPDAGKIVADALRITFGLGNADSLVIAYRGFPELLNVIPNTPDLRSGLGQIMRNANDSALAHRIGVSTDKRDNEPLTRRENEVVGLIAQGLTNKAIARTLFISEATVKVHVLHIFEKLGVRSRTEAALKATMDPQED